MIQQLCFDLGLIRQKKGCCLLLLAANIVYLIVGITVFHISLDYGAVFTFLVTAINIDVIMLMINLHMSGNGIYVSNYTSCIYFPTKRAHFFNSKVVIEVGIVCYQCVCSSLLYVLGNSIYKKSFVLEYWLSYIVPIIIVASVVSSTVMISSFSGNAFRIGIIVASTILGGVIGVFTSLLRDEQSKMKGVSLKTALIILCIMLGIRVVSYVIVRFIVKQVNV